MLDFDKFVTQGTKTPLLGVPACGRQDGGL